MSSKRRKFSAQFKFRIALEAARDEKTITQLSSEHGIHPNQISQWKRQLIERGPELFSRSSSDGDPKREAVESELFEQIGRLKMELEWVKKKSGPLS